VLSIRIRWDMRLTDREVLKAINGLDKPLSQEAIADSLDCGRRTVQRAIKRLKDNGILSVVGDTNPATYKINKDALPEALQQELQ
jgi:predicted transcriptional regulator